MNRATPALVIGFGGAGAALLGLAWDVSIHSTFPSLAAHESPFDVLSPAHDLIAIGILVAASSAAWTIAREVSTRLGLAAVAVIVISVGWIGDASLTVPALPTGTSEQRAAAKALWQQTETATERYRTLAAAKTDGYIAYNSVGQRLVHYVNPSYMQDGRVLDPSHVESLLYENTLKGWVLVAAMYSQEDPNSAPPDVAGDLTPWHRHDDLCFTRSGAVVGGAPGCPPGSATYFTPWMLHVWFVSNRYGRFAADLDSWSELAIELFG